MGRSKRSRIKVSLSGVKKNKQRIVKKKFTKPTYAHKEKIALRRTFGGSPLSEMERREGDLPCGRGERFVTTLRAMWQKEDEGRLKSIGREFEPDSPIDFIAAVHRGRKCLGDRSRTACGGGKKRGR